MATLVEMGVAPYPGKYPQVKINDRDQAKLFVEILEKNGVPVNLREVPDNYDGTSPQDIGVRHAEVFDQT